MNTNLHSEKTELWQDDFQVIDVDEPSVEEAINILHGVTPAYEQFHGITYDEDAVEEAARLAATHIRESKLPIRPLMFSMKLVPVAVWQRFLL